jgi:hypothetical protein
MATAGTVFTLRIYTKGSNGDPVPRFIQIIFFKMIARFFHIKVRSIKKKQITKKSSHNINDNNETRKNSDETTNSSSRDSTELDFNSNDKLAKSSSPIEFLNSSKFYTLPNRRSMEMSNEMRNTRIRDYDKEIESPLKSNVNYSPLNWHPNANKNKEKSISKTNIDADGEKSSLIMLLNSINTNLNNKFINKKETKYLEKVKNQWSQLARVFDILFFFIFVIVTIISYFMCLKMATK